MSGAPRRRGARIVVALLLVCLSGAAYGYLVVRLQAATTTDARVVAAEQAGVMFLRPLTQLTGELAKAGSAAAHGKGVNFDEINSAAALVTQADSVVGGGLGSGQRWKDLRSRIEELATTKPAGAAAAQQYGQATALAQELALKIGDTSHLILDPELDSYYLMDVALLRLPVVMLGAARAAGAAALPRTPERTDALVEMAVSRFEVAGAADAVSVGLGKAQDATKRTVLGQNLNAPMGEFRNAVDQLSPPVALRPQMSTTDAAAIHDAVQRVLQASLGLSRSSLAELDALLQARADRLAGQRSTTLMLAVAGTVLVMLLLWWSTPPADPSTAQDAEDAHAQQALQSMPPHELLDTEELLHLGRGVRARSREQAGDAR